MESTAEKVALRVRAMREARGWSVRELARRTDLAQQTVSNVESGDSGCQTKTLEKIAAAFGCPVVALFL